MLLLFTSLSFLLQQGNMLWKQAWISCVFSGFRVLKSCFPDQLTSHTGKSISFFNRHLHLWLQMILSRLVTHLIHQLWKNSTLEKIDLPPLNILETFALGFECNCKRETQDMFSEMPICLDFHSIVEVYQFLIWHTILLLYKFVMLFFASIFKYFIWC